MCAHRLGIFIPSVRRQWNQDEEFCHITTSYHYYQLKMRAILL